jgi:hypothetical protein
MSYTPQPLLVLIRHIWNRMLQRLLLYLHDADSRFVPCKSAGCLYWYRLGGSIPGESDVGLTLYCALQMCVQNIYRINGYIQTPPVCCYVLGYQTHARMGSMGTKEQSSYV